MGFNINNFFDNLTSRLTGGLSSLSNNLNTLLGKSQDGDSSAVNKTEETGWLAWLGKPTAKTPGFNPKSNDVLLRQLAADKVQLSESDIDAQNTREAARYNLVQTSPQPDRTGKNKTPAPPQPHPISAPKIDASAIEPPVRGHKPYSILIPLPAGKEKVPYEQLQRAVIRDVFSHHGIYTSRAAVEDFIATHGDIDLNEQIYRNQEGETVATRNRMPGLMPEIGAFVDETTGKEVRGYKLTVTNEFQSFVLGERDKAEAITKAGTKVVPELSMNERMQKAMQIAYDKHLPHSVGAALREVDPKQLMVGVAVAGGVVAVASKAGAAKAIPLVGAGVTLAQVASYHAEGEHFLKLCATAKTEADLDKAAQQFASIVKQGGIDVGLTLATAGAAKLGAVSRAGGQLVDDAMRIAEDATKTALAMFAQWNDEIVVGMKQAFGEDLAVENVPSRATTTGTTSRTSDLDDLLNAPMQARRAGDPPSGTPEHRELRWQQYQEKGGKETYEVWSKKYEVNMQQARKANARVDAFHKELGWGEREVTIEVNKGVSRRLDIADKEMKKGIEHKTGEQSLNEAIRWEIERDKMLVKKGWDIEWHFEGTASKPLLEALEKAGIRHNLGGSR